MKTPDGGKRKALQCNDVTSAKSEDKPKEKDSGRNLPHENSTVVLRNGNLSSREQDIRNELRDDGEGRLQKKVSLMVSKFTRCFTYGERTRSPLFKTNEPEDEDVCNGSGKANLGIG